MSDREAAIRAYIQAQPEDWQGEDAAFLNNVYDLLADLAAARERLAHEQLRTQHEIQRWQEAEAREEKLREALRALADMPVRWPTDETGALQEVARAALADGEGET